MSERCIDHLERSDDGLAIVYRHTGGAKSRRVVVPVGVEEHMPGETFGDWLARHGCPPNDCDAGVLFFALKAEREQHPGALNEGVQVM